VGLKRNFDEETGEDEEFSLGNAGTDPDISLNNGFLLLSKTEIQGIFKPLFREILAFVKEQITSVESLGQGSRVKTVFLVGGFGSNGYLRTFLESQLGADITVIQPPQT
jgi:Tfp pilus assembly PilM family ATPase